MDNFFNYFKGLLTDDQLALIRQADLDACQLLFSQGHVNVAPPAPPAPIVEIKAPPAPPAQIDVTPAPPALPAPPAPIIDLQAIIQATIQATTIALLKQQRADLQVNDVQDIDKPIQVKAINNKVSKPNMIYVKATRSHMGYDWPKKTRSIN